MESLERHSTRRVEAAIALASIAVIAGYAGLRLTRGRTLSRQMAQGEPLVPAHRDMLQELDTKVTGLLAAAAERGLADDERTPRVAMWFSPGLETLIAVNNLYVSPRGEHRRAVILQACREQEGVYYMALPDHHQLPELRPRHDVSWTLPDAASAATGTRPFRFASGSLPVDGALAEVSQALAADDLVAVDFRAPGVTSWDVPRLPD